MQFKREYFSEKFHEICLKLYPFGFKDHFKLLIKDAIPLILTNLSEFTFSMVSLFFCGHLGTDELDAVSLANTLISAFGLAIVVGITSAAETIFPQSFASKNKKNVGVTLQKGIIIGLVAAIISTALLVNSKGFMIMLNQNPEVISLADQYVLIYVPSIFFYSITNILNRFVQCQNIVNPILLINLVANIINAILHAIFIYGFKTGTNGSAASILISNVFLTGATIYYIYRSKLYVDTWGGWSWECLEDWKSYLKLGVPGIFMLILEWFIYEIGAFIAGTVGKTELGVQSIVLQILSFCFMIPNGIGVAGNILVGHLLGMNKPEEATNAYRVVMSLATIFGLAVVLIITATAEILPWAFTQEKAIQEYSSKVLLIIAGLHLFDAIQATFSGILRSVGAQMQGMCISFTSYYVIGLPIGICLMLKTPLSLYGFWIGMLIASIAQVIMQVVFSLRINWQEKANIALENAKVTESLESSFETEQKISKVFQLEDPIFNSPKNSLVSSRHENHKRLLYLRIVVFIAAFMIAAIGLTLHAIIEIPAANNSTNTSSTTVFPSTASPVPISFFKFF